MRAPRLLSARSQEQLRLSKEPHWRDVGIISGSIRQSYKVELRLRIESKCGHDIRTLEAVVKMEDYRTKTVRDRNSPGE